VEKNGKGFLNNNIALHDTTSLTTNQPKRWNKKKDGNDEVKFHSNIVNDIVGKLDSTI